MTLEELELLAKMGMFDAYREEIGIEGVAVKALVRKLIVVAMAAKLYRDKVDYTGGDSTQYFREEQYALDKALAALEVPE